MLSQDAPTTLDKDSEYAKRFREHLALINQLRAIGAQMDLDLPRVAVIGSQSAGKSSLVEAISGITVPRDVGTCTRCPIECRMYNAPGRSWSCQISVRWEHPTASHPAGEVPFGPRLTHKADVEFMLRRAQAAVLNPDAGMSKFLTISKEDLRQLGTNQLPFSRHTVCIELSAPELTDLAFVDLPGIIQNANKSTVKLVEDIVLSHITGNCIILVALPMSDDIDNQGVMQMAKKVDPEGVRTIGVLTKPDTIPAGASTMRERWLDVIQGLSHQLKLGYYCTRQPDEDERAAQISTEDARAAEAAFFARTVPWCTATRKHRFGTQNLVTALSGHLIHIIDQSLPKLADETDKRLAACVASLASIPQPVTSEPFTFILSLVQAFCAAVRSFVDGHLETATLVQANRDSYASYKRRICSTAPLFVPYDYEVSFADIPDELRRVDDGENTSFFQPQITLAAVKETIKKATTRELPNNTPYAAKLRFIKDFQLTWPTLTQMLTENVHAALSSVVLNLIRTNFGRYHHLEPLIRKAVDELLQVKLSTTTAQTSRLLKYGERTFTQNDVYLANVQHELAQYKDIRARKIQALKPNPSVPPQDITQARTPAVRCNDQTSHAHRKDSASILAPLPAALTPAAAGPSPMVLNVAKVAFGKTEFRTSAFENLLPAAPVPRVGVHMPTPAASSQIMDTYHAEASSSARTSGASALSDHAANKPIVAPSSASVGAASYAPLSSRDSNTPPAPASQQQNRVLSAEERERAQRTALEALSQLGISGLTLADLQKLRGPDEFEEELTLMAEVRAYFKIAYQRVIDFIPLSIDAELLYAFSDELQAHLVAALGLSADNAAARCSAYLAEDPRTVAEREDLLAKKKMLMGVQAELRNAGMY